MRLAEVLGEALRNLRSGSSRAGVLVLYSTVCATLLLTADAALVGGLQSRADEIRAHAGSIRVLVAEDAVDPRACANLEQLEGIGGAGPIWSLSPVHLDALPQLQIPVFQVSEGVARMLGFPHARSGGVYVSALLAERWGAHPGAQLDTSSGPVGVHGVFDYPDDDGRDPRLASAIVVVGDSSERAAECWFDVWPPSARMDPYAFGALTPSGADAGPLVAPLNPTMGARVDFAAEYAARVTSFSAPAVVGLFAITGAASIARRRIEVASNLHAGARRRDLVLAIAAETATWSGAAGIASFAVTRLASGMLLREELASFQASIAVTLLIGAVAATVGAIIPVLIAREDRLFAIFKSRA